MTVSLDKATQTARDYYNSDDADRFYAEVWGGEDIHVGMYNSHDEPIKTASRRTVDHMADRLVGVGKSSTVLDIGSGYGGAARRFVERFGCNVICVNLSEIENERNRQLNELNGCAEKINVIDGSFEDLPLENASVNFVWSQDAILHSGNRTKVLQEVDRVMKDGSQFVFTDPMRSDATEVEALRPILERIHLSDLGSPGFYTRVAKELGWIDKGFKDYTFQLSRHYKRVLETTEAMEQSLVGTISPDYIVRMKNGLQHWIDGGKLGQLKWGVFLFVKPDSH